MLRGATLPSIGVIPCSEQEMVVQSLVCDCTYVQSASNEVQLGKWDSEKHSRYATRGDCWLLPSRQKSAAGARREAEPIVAMIPP